MLPVIPGSAINGVMRTAMALREKSKISSAITCHPGSGAAPEAEHCGKPDCPVCSIFGYADRGDSFHKGCCLFSDAHLVLYPVYENRRGPVYITTESAFTAINKFSGEDDTSFKQNSEKDILLIGWNSVDSIRITRGQNPAMGININREVHLVNEKDFSLLVNANMEIRTSVSINPRTGTAAEAALFSYEAVPRDGFFLFEFTIYDPALDNPKAPDIEILTNHLADALQDLTWCSMGGLNTRGMGRMERIGFYTEEVC